MSFTVRRLLGALALAVSLLRVVSPELGHQCDMQDSRAKLASAEVAPNAHAGHGAHAAPAPSIHHEHGQGVEAAEPLPESPSPIDAPCNCAAWCCCLPSLVSPPAPSVGIVATVSAITQPITHTATTIPVVRQAHRLPFATAPPVV
jgi:hypothetical protein